MSISVEELANRIKRLLVLFPEHIHILDASHFRDKELLKALLSDVATITWGNNEIRIHMKNHSGSNKLWYDYRIYSTLRKSTFQVKSHDEIGYIGLEFDVNKMWNDISQDNCFVPKIQCDILTAIYGPEWVDYITIEVLVPITLINPKLEKIA